MGGSHARQTKQNSGASWYQLNKGSSNRVKAPHTTNRPKALFRKSLNEIPATSASSLPTGTRLPSLHYGAYVHDHVQKFIEKERRGCASGDDSPFVRKTKKW